MDYILYLIWLFLYNNILPMDCKESGYSKPKTESAQWKEQIVIHLWEKLRDKYGDLFDDVSKTRRINDIAAITHNSHGWIKVKVNAYIKGHIKYRPELFDPGEYPEITRI